MDTTTNNKTRYSDEELAEFRELIEQKLDEAKKQLAYYKKQLAEMADNPDSKVKSLEDGTGSAEREQLTQLAARQENLIVHLENALLRIENKVYGICRKTGKLISKERLKAVPHATLSIELEDGLRVL